MPAHTCSRLQRLEVQLQVTSTLLQRRALLKSSTVIFLLLACLMNWELLCECPQNDSSLLKETVGTVIFQHDPRSQPSLTCVASLSR